MDTMPLEYKLVIIFIVAGILNLLLKRNRNWVLGYRSTRCLKSHDRFAFANRIFGWGLIILGLMYLGILLYLAQDGDELTGWESVFIIVGYLALLFILIEYKLSKAFKE
ncbi:MAG: SdpI family protein [Marinoscillum sp.]|uniref:SdpI family protein n=1 Tax=Marinoscillum sp. TaxID=2024838 RepID=UPI0032F10908